MRKLRRKRTGLALAAIDMLSTLFLIALVLMNPRHASAVETQGAYAVVLTWPRACNADLDLHTRTPSGAHVYFDAQSGGGAFLEHDDLGIKESYATGDNFERLVVRQLEQGEYVETVHVYDRHSCRLPVTATVELWRLAGLDARLHAQSVRLRYDGQEVTAFRWRVNGTRASFNRLPASLVYG